MREVWRSETLGKLKYKGTWMPKWVMWSLKTHPKAGACHLRLSHLPVVPGDSRQATRIALPERIQIGNSNFAAPHLCFGGIGSSVAPTPASNFDGNWARVAPIGAGPPSAFSVGAPQVMGVAHPMVSEALRISRVKKFSGKAEDFEEFEKSWNFHLRMMQGASNGPLSDAVVLMNLRGYIDEASGALLEGRMYNDPNLSYYEFWDELKAKYMRDARTTHRQNWRGVRFQISGTKLSVYDWARFQNLYQAKRALVEDWTDGEDQQFVFTQVPHEFQQKSLNETTKRRMQKRWVRVVVPAGLTHQVVLDELSKLVGYPLTNCTVERRNMVIPCRDDQERLKMIRFDGAKLDGHVLRFQKADYNMTGDEIFEFVQRMLETNEELRNLRQFYGCPHDPPTPRGGVKAVQVEEAPKKKFPSPTRDSRPKKDVGGRGQSKSGRGGRGVVQSLAGSPQPRQESSKPQRVVAPIEPKPENVWKNPKKTDPPKVAQNGPKRERTPSPQKSSGNSRNAQDECYTCKNAGRPCNHSWVPCEYAQEWRTKNLRESNGKKVAKPEAIPRPGTPPQPRPKSE